MTEIVAQFADPLGKFKRLLRRDLANHLTAALINNLDDGALSSVIHRKLQPFLNRFNKTLNLLYCLLDILLVATGCLLLRTFFTRFG